MPAHCGSVEPAEGGFRHGLASFDPLHDKVLIWTRVTPPADTLLHKEKQSVELEVRWELSTNKNFAPGPTTQAGVVITSPASDYTVCVDVSGLKDNTRYFYRFHWAGETSPVGRTKTIPAGSIEELKLALISCCNFEFGYFHVLDLVRRLDGVDVVVHAGDYIYEYKNAEYPARHLRARTGLRPKAHCETLEQFRERYACYRRDPALQAMHQAVPMIAIW